MTDSHFTRSGASPPSAVNVVEQLTVQKVHQQLYSLAAAAALLGLTLPALRSQIFRDRVRVIKLGRRVLVSSNEIARITEGA